MGLLIRGSGRPDSGMDASRDDPAQRFAAATAAERRAGEERLATPVDARRAPVCRAASAAARFAAALARAVPGAMPPVAQPAPSNPRSRPPRAGSERGPFVGNKRGRFEGAGRLVARVMAGVGRAREGRPPRGGGPEAAAASTAQRSPESALLERRLGACAAQPARSQQVCGWRAPCPRSAVRTGADRRSHGAQGRTARGVTDAAQPGRAESEHVPGRSGGKTTQGEAEPRAAAAAAGLPTSGVAPLAAWRRSQRRAQAPSRLPRPLRLP